MSAAKNEGKDVRVMYVLSPWIIGAVYELIQ